MEWEREYRRIGKELKNLQGLIEKSPSKKRAAICDRKFRKEREAIKILIETSSTKEQREKALDQQIILENCLAEKLVEKMVGEWA